MIRLSVKPHCMMGNSTDFFITKLEVTQIPYIFKISKHKINEITLRTEVDI